MKPGELDQFTNLEYTQSLEAIKIARSEALKTYMANASIVSLGFLWFAGTCVSILLKVMYLILSELRENHL